MKDRNPLNIAIGHDTIREFFASFIQAETGTTVKAMHFDQCKNHSSKCCCECNCWYDH